MQDSFLNLFILLKVDYKYCISYIRNGIISYSLKKGVFKMKNRILLGLVAIFIGLFGVAGGIVLYTSYYLNNQTSSAPTASVETWVDEGTAATEETAEPTDALTAASEEATPDATTGASESVPPVDAVSGASEETTAPDAVSGASEEADGENYEREDEHEEYEREDDDEHEDDDD